MREGKREKRRQKRNEREEEREREREKKRDRKERGYNGKEIKGEGARDYLSPNKIKVRSVV